jgi:hypothetical protein
MATTEIALRQRAEIATERDIIDGWITVVGDVAKLADYIAETDFVPKGLRNRPAAIAACILTGRELGIGPMASLKSIHMVQGVPSLSAEYKRARALAAGHQIVIDETNSTRCIARGRRSGAENWLTITWTIDHAKRAKLDGKDVWKQYPQRMLQARATGELCDLLFPDATLGLPTTEELEDGGALAIDGVTVADPLTEASTPAIEPPKPAAAPGRTARRRTATTPAAAVPDGQAPSGPAAAAGPAAPAATSPAPDLPPLPGEEEITAPVSGDQARAPEAAKASSSGPRAAAAGEHHDAVANQRVTDLFDELASHADHQMKQIGRCVYCVPCNARLYQGRAPNAKEREDLREYARQRAAEGGSDPDARDPSAPAGDRHRKIVGIVHQHFKRLGFSDDDDKAERLWAAAKIAGTGELASLNDLDPGELSTVADALAKCRDRKRLEEILAAAGEQPGDGDG